MTREKLGGLVMLIFSIAYGIQAFRLPLSFLAQQESFNSRTMPLALAVAGIVFSLAILILPTVDPDGKPTLGQVTKGMEFKKTGLLIVSMIIYGLIMKWIGFLISSAIFLMAGFYILGERRIKIMLLGAIPLVIVLWIIMSLLLGVYIAPGELFYIMGIIDV
ncbi:tripartite tricarboxylate transporter TctB family protein [Limisalsivibrio acetivorans]|uniref:tripartite tricarboxylate transporter TctB family protein n=1 Tax=Limisalsivibrio acetivorans TaxID=1304888 RepID=UPI0003B736BD|nr:tripartite tricarboxylate transporter TctB family protein [Limisalsivibrio acetivorans]